MQRKKGGRYTQLSGGKKRGIEGKFKHKKRRRWPQDARDWNIFLGKKPRGEKRGGGKVLQKKPVEEREMGQNVARRTTHEKRP